MSKPTVLDLYEFKNNRIVDTAESKYFEDCGLKMVDIYDNVFNIHPNLRDLYEKFQSELNIEYEPLSDKIEIMQEYINVLEKSVSDILRYIDILNECKSELISIDEMLEIK